MASLLRASASQAMSLHKLVLAPVNPAQVPHDMDGLVRSLERLGLTGTPFQLAGHTHYLPGERFLGLVTFLGCSPAIALAPPEGAQADPGIHSKTFCHVRLWYAGDQPVFLAGRNTPAPRCSSCRHPVKNWREMLGAWEASPSSYLWTCPACTEQSTRYQLDWRQSAGFGRFFLEVWGIHSAEAVPSEMLLETLQRSTDGHWSFFYLEID